jgi:hypothetical protein
MSISRPFAYNTGSSIPGTDQVGNLAIGYPTAGFEGTGLPWWEGPDETLGYVICKPVPTNSQLTPVTTNQIILDETYKGSDITLAGTPYQIAYQNNLSFQQSALGTTPIGASDKVFFSVTAQMNDPATQADSHFVGIGYHSMNYEGSPTGGFPGNDANSIGYCSDGKIWYDGSVYTTPTFQSWTNGDVIDIAIDNNINGMWVRVNGGDWNNDPVADPATGTNAFEIINGPFYPVLCPGYDAALLIQNTPQYGVPLGYTNLGRSLASVGFSRSSALDESSFITLANKISGQDFPNGNDAKDWLNTNGYWTSYGILSSFTINPSDFTGGGPIYQNTFGVGTNGVDGFVNTAAQGNFLEGYYGAGLTAGAISTISAAITQAGLDPNNNTGYIWSVTWGAGSSISSGYVKFGYYEPGGYFDIQTVDPSDTDWQLPGYNNGTSLAGTFLFPATFTQYLPLTNKGGWC